MNKVNVLICFRIPRSWESIIESNFSPNINLFYSRDIYFKKKIDCIVLSPIGENIIKDYSQFPNLSLVHVWGTGVDEIPTDVFRKRKIKMIVLSGLHEQLIAEYVFGSIMLWEREFFSLNKFIRSGKWNSESSREFITNSKISQISEKTLLIFGLGRTGKAVAKYAKKNGMNIIGIIKNKGYLKRLEGSEIFDKIATQKEMYYLLNKADYVSLHIPLNEDTKGIVNREFFGKMNQNSVLINTARGAIIDDDNLVFAIDNNLIRGATLDVFNQEPLSLDHPFLKRERILLTPHVAATACNSPETTICTISKNICSYYQICE